MATLSSKEVISMLVNLGWCVQPKRGKGSHTVLKLVTASGTKSVTVPHSKELPMGTQRSIERAAGTRLR